MQACRRHGDDDEGKRWSSTSPTCSSTPSTLRRPRVPGGRRASAAPTPRWRSGPTGSPTTSPPRASAPATTSASTACNSRRVGRERCGRSSSCGPCGSTSTTATSRTSCAYLFDNADLKALVHQRRSSPTGSPACVGRTCPTAAAHGSVIGRVDYEDGAGRGVARARLRPPLPRRPLHPLHRRHHRACPRASCGATRTCSSPSAAASTSVTGERVDRTRGHGRARASSRLRRSRSCPSRRSCTAPPSGR